MLWCRLSIGGKEKLGHGFASARNTYRQVANLPGIFVQRRPPVGYIG
jgi:hypothetical protein